MYTIKIYYVDGDSYNMHDHEDELPVQWKDKVLARKALQCIKEHYQFILELEDSRSSYKDVFQKYSTKNWYINDTILHMNEQQLEVELDDGTLHKIHAFWRGWPARLEKAEIIEVLNDNDNEDCFTVSNW